MTDLLTGVKCRATSEAKNRERGDSMNGSKSVHFQQISENIKLPASDTYGCLFSMACTNFLRNLYFLTWFCPKSSRTTSLEKQPLVET